MCGIFGIVTNKDQQLGPTMIDAGKRLSYRGYDSVGCATLNGAGEIDLRKDVGKVEEVAARLNFSEMIGKRGILQLRWATFGPPSQVNTQPHLDSDGDIVGAHNGNIVNHIELREQFIAEGLNVRSTNDGETCIHAVERYINRGFNFIQAIQNAYHDLVGDYAFVIGRINEKELYAIKKGSGLVVGIGDGFTCVSSDLPSILPLTRNIIRIQDGEIVTLRADSIEIHNVIDGGKIERAIEVVTETMESAQKDGYAHFMLKEIHEQSAVAGELLRLLENSKDVQVILEKISQARHLYLVGCGTSYHACILGSVFLSQLSGRAAIPILAPQFVAQYADSLSSSDVGIFVSQSGETKDVLNAMQVAEGNNVTVLSFVNVIGSTLMQASEQCIPLACGYEISVPATKTFTNQAITFLYLASRLGNRTDIDLTKLPAQIKHTIEFVQPQIAKISRKLAEKEDLYCLGYGLTYPIALEGALKLKEITYAHCEGMLSTEFKHGPLSAIQDDYPVLFVTSPNDVSIIVSGINEVTCRGGYAIAIGEEDSRLISNAHDLISLPKSNPHINAILATIPLQLLSYQVSIQRGFDPDFPRNLSKTLTVD